MNKKEISETYNKFLKEKTKKVKSKNIETKQIYELIFLIEFIINNLNLGEKETLEKRAILSIYYDIISCLKGVIGCVQFESFISVDILTRSIFDRAMTIGLLLSEKSQFTKSKRIESFIHFGGIIIYLSSPKGLFRNTELDIALKQDFIKNEKKFRKKKGISNRIQDYDFTRFFDSKKGISNKKKMEILFKSLNLNDLTEGFFGIYSILSKATHGTILNETYLNRGTIRGIDTQITIFTVIGLILLSQYGNDEKLELFLTEKLFNYLQSNVPPQSKPTS